ncbi:MAG: DUF2804 domain-containing protein [Spirochaetales bacterium]|nr:DUF2804 domain-containing protein [Spirochaetales bacterium]
MQREVKTETVLLDGQGNVGTPGWAKKSFFKYDREMIKAGKFRIKEWDYYCILSSEYGLAITAADNGYMAFYSVTLLDFINKTETSGSVMTPFSMGKLNMPSSSSEGDVVVDKKAIKLSFVHNSGGRVLSVNYPGFDGGKGFESEIVLEQNVDDDRMVIATPFNKKGHFYFNEKHNCLRARGSVKSGNFSYTFGDGAYAVLDWGRGVWTYRNTWYWGSASGEVEGAPFGFNIGYGFGDTAAATENMLFYNGKAHKLEDVTFNIPLGADGREVYTDTWNFNSSDGRFELDFIPIIDRFSDSNVLLIRSRQHQVFGYFSGKVVLDGGSELKIKNLLGFAEKVYNRW